MVLVLSRVVTGEGEWVTYHSSLFVVDRERLKSEACRFWRKNPKMSSLSTNHDPHAMESSQDNGFSS